jgi:hypothetical protein
MKIRFLLKLAVASVLLTTLSGMRPALSALATPPQTSPNDLHKSGEPLNPVAVSTVNTWNALGSGVDAIVRTIAVDGTDVYAGGDFTDAGGVLSTTHIARWDGSTWHALGDGLNGGVYAIAVDGSNVYVGGDFTDAGGVTNANYIARWDGSNWHALGNGLNDWAEEIVVDGANVYVGGGFTDAGGVANTTYIARWDGSTWHALGNGLSAWASAIAVDGENVYVGGGFTDAGGVANTTYIARWDGFTWYALDSGLNNRVLDIAVVGSDIYVGGAFTNAGGVANYIARWDGSAWYALGSGLNSWVNSIAVDGTNLYVGGLFTSAGGNYLARWDCSNWYALDSGLNNQVYTLALQGANLYAGGLFTGAGGDANGNYIARWEFNQPPVADAGADQVVDTLALVTLDGSASNDPDGHLPLTYQWTQDGGPAVTLSDSAVISPTFSAPTDPTVLTFTLVVTDSLGLVSTLDEIVVTVENQPPVADAGVDQVVDTLTLVTLDGSASNDPDGHLPLTYQWTQDGGPAVTLSDSAAISPTFSAPTDPAVLTFTLMVTDSLGLASAPDEIVVRVNNQPPVADAGPDQSVDTLTLVTLDGSASTDPDGHLPLTYQWTQSSGPAVTLINPTSVSPTFSAPADSAVLTFTLIVTDSLGLASTPDEVVITEQLYRIYLPLVIQH